MGFALSHTARSGAPDAAGANCTDNTFKKTPYGYMICGAGYGQPCVVF
jgi:hypothetical protein